MPSVVYDQRDANPCLVYRDAQADARNRSLDVLVSGIDLFQSTADDPESDPFERYNAAERFRAFSEEIARRERVARLRGRRATRHDRDHATWTRLADIVKERVAVPEVLQLAGIAVTRTGRNRRSGATEFHSACPVCRDGVDRLVSWDGPGGRAWCRRCGWSTDVIGVASLIAGDQFRDIVIWLAEYAGMAVPDAR